MYDVFIDDTNKTYSRTVLNVKQMNGLRTDCIQNVSLVITEYSNDQQLWEAMLAGNDYFLRFEITATPYLRYWCFMKLFVHPR